MTKDVQVAVLKMAEENGIEAREYDGAYSGRGMFGRTTFAIVVETVGDIEELSDLWNGRLAREGRDVDGFRFRWDNLGLSYVVY